MTAQTGREPGQEQSQDRRQPQPERRDQPNLSRRYGAIGIASVAAALRYTGATKSPAQAPVVWRIDARFIEAAA